MTSIENTTERDPFIHLAGSMGPGGVSGYIEEMEAQGQAAVVASTALPVDSPWEELAELGVHRVGQPDGLFVDVTLPDGWTRRGSDHAMHSFIADERGVDRIGIFYKAAFYDRRADSHIISVAGAAATEAIYGDDDAPVPAKWDVFTDAERDGYRRQLNQFLKMADADDVRRQVYGKYVPRAQSALELVTGGDWA